jgi:hypothetical protein
MLIRGTLFGSVGARSTPDLLLLIRLRTRGKFRFHPYISLPLLSGGAGLLSDTERNTQAIIDAEQKV